MTEKWDVREECDGCGYGPVECVHLDAPHGTEPGRLKDEGLWLCEFCYCGPCGTAASYPRNAISEDAALRAISVAANVLLREIRLMRQQVTR